MLYNLDIHHDSLFNPVAVELAIYFHDWIYDPQSRNNGKNSAAEFVRYANDLGLEGSVQNVVKSMIEATIKHEVLIDILEHEREDVELFLDLDLEVLSRPWEEYEVYARQIQTEYDCYDDDSFREGRVKVLRSFLGRQRIYFSKVFHDEKEAIARANISKEIELLESKQLD